METSVAPIAATLSGNRLNEASTQLQATADARKCWSCGCLGHALEAFARAVPEPDCYRRNTSALVCEVCYPAGALNALGAAGGCVVDIYPTVFLAKDRGRAHRQASLGIVIVLPY